MRTTQAYRLAAVVLLCLGTRAARAGDGGFEIAVLAGAAFGSHDSRQSASSVDNFGSQTANELRSDAATGFAYGVSARYLTSSGFGVAVIYERARLGLDTTTQVSLRWDSVLGPQSEAFSLDGTGKLQLDPLSLDLLFRKEICPRLGLEVSAGFTYERIDLEDRSRVGLVTYVGDSIEAFAADTFASETRWRPTWNAGLDLDFRVAGPLSVFVGGRYYGNAKGTVNGRSVQAGTYAGMHLGGNVTLSTADAAARARDISGATYSAEIDTRMVRAAAGVRYRF